MWNLNINSNVAEQEPADCVYGKSIFLSTKKLLVIEFKKHENLYFDDGKSCEGRLAWSDCSFCSDAKVSVSRLRYSQPGIASISHGAAVKLKVGPMTCSTGQVRLTYSSLPQSNWRRKHIYAVGLSLLRLLQRKTEKQSEKNFPDRFIHSTIFFCVC